MTIEEIEKQTQEGWEKVWKPLLYTKGKLDIKKIKNEMHDLIFIYEQVGKVYYDLTGGTLSKPMYYAGEIISLHEQEIEDSYNRGYEDAKEELPHLQPTEAVLEYLIKNKDLLYASTDIEETLNTLFKTYLAERGKK